MPSFMLKFSWVTILQGVEFFHFPIDFCMGLTTVQRKGAACETVQNTASGTIDD